MANDINADFYSVSRPEPKPPLVPAVKPQPPVTNQIPEPNSKEWYALWRGLAIGLEALEVQTTKPDGSKRRALTDDFMLMHVNSSGAGFKHHDTRNYVYLMSDGRLVIPKTFEPFHRGEF